MANTTFIENWRKVSRTTTSPTSTYRVLIVLLCDSYQKFQAKESNNFLRVWSHILCIHLLLFYLSIATFLLPNYSRYHSTSSLIQTYSTPLFKWSSLLTTTMMTMTMMTMTLNLTLTLTLTLASCWWCLYNDAEIMCWYDLSVMTLTSSRWPPSCFTRRRRQWGRPVRGGVWGRAGKRDPHSCRWGNRPYLSLAT